MAKRRSKHPLQGLGPEDAKQIVCNTCDKIVMVARDRGTLVKALVGHLDDHHELVGNVGLILEGPTGHFVIEKAPPIRCDLCSDAIELPVWTWVTPRAPDYPVEDPGWAVCDGCDPLVRAHDVLGLCRRIWEVSSGVFHYDDARQRKEDIRYVVVGFLDHIDPARTVRTTLTGDVRP